MSGYFRHPCCWRYEYNCPEWVWQSGDACADCQVSSATILTKASLQCRQAAGRGTQRDSRPCDQEKTGWNGLVLEKERFQDVDALAITQISRILTL